MKNTIYKCFQKGVVVYSGHTEEEAVNWLEQNDGGLFKNILHNYQYTVNAGGKNEIPARLFKRTEVREGK